MCCQRKIKETRKHLLNKKFGIYNYTQNDHTNQNLAESIHIFGSASVAVMEAISVLQVSIKGGMTETFGSHQGGCHQSHPLTFYSLVQIEVYCSLFKCTIHHKIPNSTGRWNEICYRAVTWWWFCSNDCVFSVQGSKVRGQGSLLPSAPAGRWAVLCVCSGWRRWRCWIWIFGSWPVWLSGCGKKRVSVSHKVGLRWLMLERT